MKERLLQTKVLKYLKSLPESFTMKLSDMWVSGYPDILFIQRGKIYFFELKSDTGRRAKIQLWTIEQLRKTGAHAYFIKSLDEIKFILTNP